MSDYKLFEIFRKFLLVNITLVYIVLAHDMT